MRQISKLESDLRRADLRLAEQSLNDARKPPYTLLTHQKRLPCNKDG
jgi:hypothetical protein